MDWSLVKPEHIDANFPSFSEYVMGDTGPDPAKLAGMKCYEDEFPTKLHPRNQWEPLSKEIENAKGNLWNLITRIMNQSREGSCVSNMWAQMLEILQAKQFGKDRVTPVSAISGYKQIGSSPNSGAMVADAMRRGCDTGMLPLDTDANKARFGKLVMPHTGFYEHYPEGWKELAKQFRFDEVFVIRTLEGLVSALLNGHPVGVGRQGHSILYSGVTFKDGRLYIPYPNSWSLQWGFGLGGFSGGFGLDTENQARMSAGWAFAGRSVVVPDHILAA